MAVLDKAAILADLETAMADTEEAITYKRCTGTTFDATTGASTPTYSSTVTVAMKGVATMRQIEFSGGRLEVGDVTFRIRSNLLAAEPVDDDQIVYEGDTFQVVLLVTKALGALYRVYARKV